MFLEIACVARGGGWFKARSGGLRIVDEAEERVQEGVQQPE